MHDFTEWISASLLSQELQRIAWIIPTVQTVHILCIALLFTSAAMLDARLLGIAGTAHPIDALVARFLPWVWATLPVLLVTGLLLIIAEPNRDLHNVAFFTKMSLIALAITVTLYLQRVTRNDPVALDASPRRARLIGAVSLLMWTAIIFCGRLIAYV